MRVCEHCGQASEDVILWHLYVGGRGYESRWYCADRLACWRRWDAMQRGEGR